MAKRGRALAIATVGMPLGTAFFVPIEQTLIDSMGWRDAWLISGVLVLLLAVPVCWIFMRKDPESMGLRPDGATTDAPVVRSAHQMENETEEEWTLKEVMRTRVLWLIFASMALTGIVVQGTLVYRVSFWTDAGIDSSVVALGTAFDPFTVVFSALLFGFLAERMRLSHLGLIGGLGVALSMVPMVIGGDHAYLLFAHNIIWGASMGANITVNNLIWPNYFGRRFLGTIRGVSFPVIVGTAAISSPIFALLLDSSPQERYVWLVTLVAFVISGLLLFLARPPRRRPTAPAREEALLPGSAIGAAAD
jgi:predicted MFS family arabinose efflux permease